MDRGRTADADPLAARFLALSERLTGTAYFVLGHREDAKEVTVRGEADGKTIGVVKMKVELRKKALPE